LGGTAVKMFSKDSKIERNRAKEAKKERFRITVLMISSWSVVFGGFAYMTDAAMAADVPPIKMVGINASRIGRMSFFLRKLSNLTKNG
jgi:hypothetical protein